MISYRGLTHTQAWAQLLTMLFFFSFFLRWKLQVSANIHKHETTADAIPPVQTHGNSTPVLQCSLRLELKRHKTKKTQLVGLKSKWECQRSSSSSLLFPHDTKQGAHSSMSRSLGWGRNMTREGEENTWRPGQGCSLHDSLFHHCFFPSLLYSFAETMFYT